MNMEEKFETYRMKKGKYFDDRVNNLPDLMEEVFSGSVDGTVTVEIDGVEVTCHVCEEVEKDGLRRVFAGKVDYPKKKSELAVRFIEQHPNQLSSDANIREAVTSKNEFLEKVTARTAEDRRKDMKDSVEN